MEKGMDFNQANASLEANSGLAAGPVQLWSAHMGNLKVIGCLLCQLSSTS